MTMIPKLRERLTQYEAELRTIADWLERYSMGQDVNDPLPSATRDVWAAVRCCREARMSLEGME